MLAMLRLIAIPITLGLFLTVCAPVPAQSRLDAFVIKDQGKFFSQETVDTANKKIAQIKRDFKKDVMVETYPAIPSDLVAVFKKEGKDKFFANWAKNRYEKQRVSGIAILLCKDPQYLQVEVGEATIQKAFTRDNRKELVQRITSQFKEGKFDQGLLAGVNFIGETLQKNLGRATIASTTPAGESLKNKPTIKSDNASVRPNEEEIKSKANIKIDNANENAEGMGIMGWVCLGLVGLLAVWFIIGLIRAMSGAGQVPVQQYRENQGGQPLYGPGGRPPGYGPGGGPPPGYGPGAPPPGYGQQPAEQPVRSGGFLPSLMGGMFGAAAGMAAYNYFTGGSMTGGNPSGMTPNAYGGTAGPDDTRAAGGDGGGADWGGGQTAGDGGASWSSNDGGGGDWGGGGGDGGGGDWGGGGGDGGGGDWGGGGGDWGGGDGGGGDW